MAIALQYRVRLSFGSPDNVSVLDLSSLLWDLNKIYVVGYREAARADSANRSPVKTTTGFRKTFSCRWRRRDTGRHSWSNSSITLAPPPLLSPSRLQRRCGSSIGRI